MTTKTPISNWLNEQLEMSALTAKELAKIVGVSEATISRLRSGKNPISTQMKLRLSQGLKINYRDIPSCSRHKKSLTTAKPLPPVYLLKGSFPSHALLNYASEAGLFTNQHVTTRTLQDHVSRYCSPQTYKMIIQKSISSGKIILLMAFKDTLPKLGLEPQLSFYSHTYKGYSFISQSEAKIPILGNRSPHKKVFILKLLLDYIQHCGMWSDPNFSRFSWLSEMDFRFIDSIRGLAHEIQTGERYTPLKQVPNTEKNSLSCLHDIGIFGADISVADCGELALAYSQPQRYHVILTLNQVAAAIDAIDPSHPPDWAKPLKTIYLADKKETALNRFKQFWAEKLTSLETEVHWQLFAPPNIEQDQLNQLKQNVLLTKNDLECQLANPVISNKILHWVRNYIIPEGDRLVQMEFFRQAWENSYYGI